ncbi:MAG: hypothetical protein O7G87_20450 [bacterium]|nr:hypothetical protein [bacterium]
MSSETTSRLTRLKKAWAHAFAVSPPGSEITPDEIDLAERVAVFLVKRRLTVPALILLETGRPLNFLGSQFLTFLSPFVSIIFSQTQDFDRFTHFLEKRKSIDCLIHKIMEVEDPHG